jgi:hypothetical protein
MRLLERIHGHLGWLAVLALLHPAILLRNPRRRARTAVVLATLVVTLAAGLGAWIYPDYRYWIKPGIFRELEWLGWCFERKEHLAVGALAFAWFGCVAHLSLGYVQESLQPRMAVLAHRAYVAAAVLATIVAILGLMVATYRSF